MFYTYKRFVTPLFLAVCLLPSGTYAQPAAKLQLYPTHIDMKDGDTSAEVSVINAGSATGAYRAELADYVMKEDGGLEALPDGVKGEYSAQPYVRIAPRSISVPPGQSQKFRLLARMPRDLPDGEYRSHVIVMMSSANTDTSQTSTEHFGVRTQPRLRTAFPVVLMKGDTHFTAQINDIRLTTSDQRKGVAVEFSVEGNRSASGDLIITFEKGGETYELFNGKRVPVYRGLSRYVYDAPIKVPEGLTLSGGTLRARYMDAENKNGGVLAEKSTQL